MPWLMRQPVLWSREQEMPRDVVLLRDPNAPAEDLVVVSEAVLAAISEAEDSLARMMIPESFALEDLIDSSRPQTANSFQTTLK